MTMGPEPMIRIVWMSSRRGIASSVCWTVPLRPVVPDAGQEADGV
jgi:hypothetical protein